MIKDENFIGLQGWMVNRFGLYGNKLNIFALIYGFSQTEGNLFTAPLKYLQAWTSLSKNTIISMLKELIEEKLILKYEYVENHIKTCYYSANLSYIEQVLNETTIQKNYMPHPKNLDAPSKKVISPIQEIWINNKYINKINNKDINNTSSANSSKQNPFDKTLKDIQKEEKETKKQIKNKTELLEKVSLDETTTETLSDINNSEVQKNREAAMERAAQRQASANIAKLNNIKKARLKRAQELFPETDIINLLDKFIDGYQYSKNIMPKEAWELILERLLSIPENKRIDAIKTSIENNYRTIYYKEVYNKPDFDNTRAHVVDKKALHEMTSQEKEEFEQKLARNADGSFMVF